MGGATSPARELRYEGESTTLVAGNLAVDLDSFRATVAGTPVDLTFQEFELLRVFAGRPGSIILYDELALALWGSVDRRNRKRLGVLLCRLRGKLAESHPYHLETVRGRGYGLMAALHDESSRV